jgi:hypothetical protein
MSGQAKRSRIRAAERHRREEARLIAEAAVGSDIDCGMCHGSGEGPFDTSTCQICGGSGAGRDALVLALLNGGGELRETFDVHAARELGERMVAQAAEHEIFVDWTMDRGLGPDNRERGAFVFDRWAYAWTDAARCEMIGHGWECGEPMARTTAACWRRFDQDPEHPTPVRSGSVWPMVKRCRGGWPGTQAREWARNGHKRSAPMGRTLARQGQRLLEFKCKDCHGTGHNLAGVLPPVEWTRAMTRKVLDARIYRRQAVGDPGQRISWVDDFPTVSDRHTTVGGGDTRTRVVPRGEHLELHHRAPRWLGYAIPIDRLPRWRRGELRHAEQRRRRVVVAQLNRLVPHGMMRDAGETDAQYRDRLRVVPP